MPIISSNYFQPDQQHQHQQAHLPQQQQQQSQPLSTASGEAPAYYANGQGYTNANVNVPDPHGAQYDDQGGYNVVPSTQAAALADNFARLTTAQDSDEDADSDTDDLSTSSGRRHGNLLQPEPEDYVVTEVSLFLH